MEAVHPLAREGILIAVLGNIVPELECTLISCKQYYPYEHLQMILIPGKSALVLVGVCGFNTAAAHSNMVWSIHATLSTSLTEKQTEV